MKSVFLTLVFICSTFIGWAQPDIEKVDKELEDLWYQGEFNKALKLSLSNKNYVEKKYGSKSIQYANALKGVAGSYYYLFDCNNAFLYINQSITVSVSCCKNTKDYADILHTKGYIFLQCNDPVSALEFFESSLKVLVDNNINEELTLGAYYSDLGYLCVQLGEMKKAEAYYNKSYSYLKNHPNEYQYPYLLNNMGDYYHWLSNFNKAKYYYEESLKITEAQIGKDNQDYANVLSNIGNLYFDFGFIDKSAKYIYASTDIYKKLYGENSLEYAESINDIALLKEYDGDFATAEKLLMQALSIKASIIGKNAESYWTSYNNLGLLYGKLGNKSKTLEVFEQLILLIPESKKGRFPSYGNYLNSLAYAYFELGRDPESEAVFKKALDFYEQYYGKGADYSRVLNNLGLLYFEKKQYKKCEESYLQSVQILKQDSVYNALELAITYNNLGELYSFRGDYKQAESYLNKATSLMKTEYSVYHPYVWTIETNVILLEYRRGNAYNAIKKSRDFNQYTLSILYKSISFLSHTEQLKYYNKLSDFFDFYNAMCVSLINKYPELATDMWNASIATKSIITDYNKKMKESILKSNNAKLIQVYHDWESTVQQLSTYYNFSKAQLLEKNIKLDSVEQRVLSLEKELSLGSEDFDILKKIPTIQWKDIQRKLGMNDAAVEIIRVQNFNNTWEDSITYIALYATKETSTTPGYVIMKNGKNLETKQYKGYLNAIKFNKPLTNYYNVFWKDIEDKIATKTNVYVSLSGVYNKINIATLRDQQDKFVIQKKNIQVVPIYRNFIYTSNKKYSDNSIVLFGKPDYSAQVNVVLKDTNSVNYNSQEALREVKLGYQLNELPGTLVEVNEVSSIFDTQHWIYKKYIGVDANELNLKQIKNPRFLHIATHGYFSKGDDLKDTSTVINTKYEDNPMLRSGLLLAGADYTLSHVVDTDNYDDGIFTAYEAMSLNLSSTELVVLSACETGLGDDAYGEGVFGLQKAFIIAGAKYMLMSLWKVDDEATQKFMVLFYDFYIKTNSIPDSYKMAQLELMKTHPNPSHWGAFVLITQ
ncbi:MAG: CHAT domain-containing tetratricopeptide repeat protein [Cytophagaceae bacterium]